MKYYALERIFDCADPSQQFNFGTIEADTQEQAWEEAELSAMNQGQVWLLTEDELNTLKETIK